MRFHLSPNIQFCASNMYQERNCVHTSPFFPNTYYLMRIIQNALDQGFFPVEWKLQWGRVLELGEHFIAKKDRGTFLKDAKYIKTLFSVKEGEHIARAGNVFTIFEGGIGPIFSQISKKLTRYKKWIGRL